jgi:hypothetical protein
MIRTHTYHTHLLVEHHVEAGPGGVAGAGEDVAARDVVVGQGVDRDLCVCVVLV